MSRSRFAVAAVVAGLVTFGGGRLLRADDPAPTPAPASDADAARIKTLIENLGSDDFRVREAATKSLIAVGEKARAALMAASKSEMPEVRFRADQILRRLDGANRAKGLEGGEPEQPGRTPGRGGAGFPGGPGGAGAGGGPDAPRGRFFKDDDWEKWQQEMERRMEEMRKGLEGAWSQGGATMPGFGWSSLLSARRGLIHLTAEGVELTRTGRGVSLTFREKLVDGVSMTTTYEGKTLDAILAAKPELKDRPGVASLVEQLAKAEAEEKAREDRLREGLKAFPGNGPRTSLQMNGVQIESTPGHVKVTVTEQGADGKPTTKTYEAADLETLKAEHPELADKLGGVHFRFDGAPGGGISIPGLKIEDEDDDADEAIATGPFGLALSAVDEVQRAKLGLAEGEGMVVRAVRPNSQAAGLGLKRGDVIVKVDGARVDARVGLADMIRRNSGVSRTFQILRDGKPMTLATSEK